MQDTPKEETAENSPASRNGCPLDKVALGRATWGLLHTMAAFYEDNPSDNQKRDMKTFLEVLSRVYPCEHCAKDFRKEYVITFKDAIAVFFKWHTLEHSLSLQPQRTSGAGEFTIRILTMAM